MANPGAPGDDKLNASRFARNDDEAKERYDKYKSRDPFPDIESALLNSADICDYVAATGMIFPFYPDKKSLKPASYRLAFGGQCIYWDAEGKEKEFTIGPGSTFTLQSDSIAFLTLEPMFRLPDYIALRFNLRIKHVYRGLLVGTGPLVDPGFEGKLHLPLHNLTTNDYVVKVGEALVWVEFTKLSDNKRWAHEQEEERGRIGRYIPFPCTKKNLPLRYYLTKAAPNRPIRSSIPRAVAESKSAAETARKAVKAAEKHFDKWRRIAIFAVAGATIAAVFAGYQLVTETMGVISSAHEEVQASREQRLDDVRRFQSLQQEVDSLLRRIDQLEAETSRPERVKHFPSPTPTAYSGE